MLQKFSKVSQPLTDFWIRCCACDLHLLLTELRMRIHHRSAKSFSPLIPIFP
jgi:hypothetical protein